MVKGLQILITVTQSRLMADCRREFKAKAEVIGRHIAPALYYFQPWQCIKSSIPFNTVKVATVISQVLDTQTVPGWVLPLRQSYIHLLPFLLGATSRS
ncbi:Uncharacterised protein [Yersinia enterocolitica]|nr:Uncharacterised protein [Yersinia enterocolitica]